jgi:hypothetical protein
MPTVIDSLVVELGLDPSKFTAGQREAARAADATVQAALAGGREVEAQGRRTNDLLLSFRREAITTLGVLFGGRGIKEFVDYITTFDASVGRIGRTLGTSGGEVATWAAAFRQIGGTTESAVGALQGLSGEMNRFQLTGQSAMLPVLSRLGVSLYDQNRNLKTSGELWLDLASAVEGMDPRQATAFLSMIPGANQDMINLALMGRRAMETMLAANRASAPTPEQIKQAQEYQKSLANINTSADNLGRTLVNWLAPALVTVMDKMNDLVKIWNTSPDSPQGQAVVAGGRAATAQRLGRPRAFMEWMRDTFSIDEADRAKWDAIIGNLYANDSPGRAHFARRLTAGNSGTSEVEAYVRAAAAARGINPDVAVQIFRAESGLNPGAVGDNSTSFGVAQLHYDGRSMGDLFSKRTGKDARDPSTWRAQVDFSLDQAKSGGWGPWHAWHGAPFAGIGTGGGGGAPRGGGGTTINVGGVTVNDHSGNADHIANTISGGLKRSLTAGSSNSGPQ